MMKEWDLALKMALRYKLIVDMYCFTTLRNKVTWRQRQTFFITMIKGAWGNAQLKKLTGQHHEARKQTELNLDGYITKNPVEVAGA